MTLFGLPPLLSCEPVAAKPFLGRSGTGGTCSPLTTHATRMFGGSVGASAAPCLQISDHAGCPMAWITKKEEDFQYTLECQDQRNWSLRLCWDEAVNLQDSTVPLIS